MSDQTRDELVTAAREADWMQVVLNQGPPCFHFEADRGRFCLRAQRWLGHVDGGEYPEHTFVPLDALLGSLPPAREAAAVSSAPPLRIGESVTATVGTVNDLAAQFPTVTGYVETVPPAPATPRCECVGTGPDCDWTADSLRNCPVHGTDRAALPVREDAPQQTENEEIDTRQSPSSLSEQGDLREVRTENAPSNGWRAIETAPKDGTRVLAWHEEEIDICWWEDRRPDGCDDMGHDAGWFGVLYSMPGRSFGNPKYFRDAQGQPTHWMPLPDSPAVVREAAPTPGEVRSTTNDDDVSTRRGTRDG